MNKISVEKVRSHSFRSVFRAPTYSGYNFSNISTTIPSLFSSKFKQTLADDVLNKNKKYKQVILFFIDGFGWRFIEQYKNHPVLKKLEKNGNVSMLSTQFPSTTAAHVTSINTGLAVCESGIYEWNYYEPTLDAVIQPLFFSYAGEKQRETLKDKNIDPKTLFPKSKLYEQLKSLGVQAHIFQDESFAQTSYGDVVMADTKIHPYTSLDHALLEIENVLKNNTDSKYLYFYYSAIDKVGHEFGPESAEFSCTVTKFLDSLDTFLKNIELQKDTLFLMTADHGQTRIYEETCWYINKEAPELLQYFKKNKNGDYLAPCGSARDMFLHINDEDAQTVLSSLQKKLTSIAEVVLTQELIDLGFFGPVISKTFLSRVGNIVILPFAEKSVWWYEQDKFWQKHKGHHGGMTPEEMETVLISYL